MILNLNNIGARAAVLLIFPTLLAVLFAGCSGGDADSKPPGTGEPGLLRAVTTIYPVTYFAERIGGGRVTVRSLISPGVEAHDFEPTPGDIIEISRADVLVFTNPDFESWVEDALDALDSPSLIAVQSSEVAPMDGPVDPHTWLNPLEAVEQVRRIESAFVAADPDGAVLFRTNADRLATELGSLDEQFRAGLQSCELSHMVVSHEAYGHLAGRYGLQQIGLANLSAEFDATPRRVAEIISEIQRLGVQHILQEPVLDDGLAKTVALETGAIILPLHPMESLTPAEQDAGDTYFTVMRRNLESLRIALRCT